MIESWDCLPYCLPYASFLVGCGRMGQSILSVPCAASSTLLLIMRGNSPQGVNLFTPCGMHHLEPDADHLMSRMINSQMNCLQLQISRLLPQHLWARLPRTLCMCGACHKRTGGHCCSCGASLSGKGMCATSAKPWRQLAGRRPSCRADSMVDRPRSRIVSSLLLIGRGAVCGSGLCPWQRRMWHAGRGPARKRRLA